MTSCEICGDEKSRRDFIRIKHFIIWYPKRVVWCRDCQKMYVKMKQFEKAKEEMEKKISGLVEFV